MPKMKTHSGAGKRYKKNKNGKVKVSKSCHRHLLTKKSRKRKRSMNQSNYISGGDLVRAQKLLPN